MNEPTVTPQCCEVCGVPYTDPQRDLGNGNTLTLNAAYDKWMEMYDNPDEQAAWLATATRDELLDILWRSERELLLDFSEDEMADYIVHLAGYADAGISHLRENIAEREGLTSEDAAPG